jgi:hypothetical protein
LVGLGRKVAEDSVKGGHKSNGEEKTPANDPATFQKSLYPNTKTLKFG